MLNNFNRIANFVARNTFCKYFSQIWYRRVQGGDHREGFVKRNKVKDCKDFYLEAKDRFLPESQGQNLALTVSCVPYTLDSKIFHKSHTQTPLWPPLLTRLHR